MSIRTSKDSISMVSFLTLMDEVKLAANKLMPTKPKTKTVKRRILIETFFKSSSEA